MHIERYGEGSQLYMGLHGWAGDHRTFAPLLRDLPSGVSFLSVDLPGCGRSPNPRAWNIGSVAEEVAGLIASCGKPVTLVGNCSGANVALFAATLVPEHVQRLIMIDALAFWPWYFRIFINRSFGRYAYHATFANPVGRFLTNFSLRSKRAKDTSLTDGFTRADHRATYRYLKMLREAGDLEQFSSLAVPEIDIAYGERSFASVRESAERMKALWPRARVTSLAGAGHLPILEATAALHALVFNNRADFKQAEHTCPTSIQTFAT